MANEWKIGSLALLAVPATLFMTLIVGIFWNASAEEPEAFPARLQPAVDWMEEKLILFRDGQPVWGWHEMVWAAPALALPAAFAVLRAPWTSKLGLVAARTMAWSMALAVALLAVEHNLDFGAPYDAAALVLATVAASVAGASSLRRNAPLSQAAGLGLVLAVLLVPPTLIVAIGPVTPALFLGLLVALAWMSVATALQASWPSRDLAAGVAAATAGASPQMEATPAGAVPAASQARGPFRPVSNVPPSAPTAQSTVRRPPTPGTPAAASAPPRLAGPPSASAPPRAPPPAQVARAPAPAARPAPQPLPRTVVAPLRRGPGAPPLASSRPPVAPPRPVGPAGPGSPARPATPPGRSPHFPPSKARPGPPPQR